MSDLMDVRDGKVLVTQEWLDFMFHRIPDVPAVFREKQLLAWAKGFRVFHCGCASPFHVELKKVCKELWGVDIKKVDDPLCIQANVEKEDFYINNVDFHLVYATEFLEHLVNPGLFLEKLKYFDCPVVISVPNAFHRVRFMWMEKGVEHINKDHNAYYSYFTLKQLVEKCGYEVKQWVWCDGHPFFAEGLMFWIEQK